jgi:PAS domain S-box-containing protein/putative nucleotidyltransferase with HDIG domain
LGVILTMIEVEKTNNELVKQVESFKLGISQLQEALVNIHANTTSLVSSELKYKRIFETAQDGIFIIDADTRKIMDVNPYLMEMLGYTKEELIGKELWEVGLFKDIQSNKAVFTELQQKGFVRYADMPLRTKAGNQIDVEFVSNVYQVNHSRVIQCDIRNISEHRKITETIARDREILRKTVDDTIKALSKIADLRDPYAFDHQGRVTMLAVAIATELNLPQDRLDFIRNAASIHDIGKVEVASEVFSKPGKLTDLEMQLARGHAQKGYDILKEIDFPWPIARVVWEHHERVDGSGYPQGLKSDEITPEAKIIAVADVVEAMASHRPYRPALGVDKALEEISVNRGKLYDPDVVDACLRVFNNGKFEFKSV